MTDIPEKILVTEHFGLPNATVTLISETWSDEPDMLYDTEVIIGDETVFCISGSRIEEFKKAMFALANEFSI